MKNHELEENNKVVADMNVPGMPWYNPRKAQKHTKDKTGSDTAGEKIILSRKERFAFIKAAFSVLIPIILFFGAGYLLILLFLRFVWLG